jgi:7-cyano-7-deazaguanine synthase
LTPLPLSFSHRPSRALVLFSGGQDSTTCLAWALERFEHVETVGFDYRQRHAIELAQRAPIIARMRAEFPHWSERLGDDHMIDAGVLATLSDSALTSERAIAMQRNGLPNTFVPARNLLFLTLAAALAYRRAIATLVGGMCETDFSGYPDCRHQTIEAMQKALVLGMAEDIAIETPLMFIDKAETWALAQRLGGDALVALIEEDTHTCYLGARGTRHAWGYGCDSCPACKLRAAGHARFRSVQVSD